MFLASLEKSISGQCSFANILTIKIQISLFQNCPENTLEMRTVLAEGKLIGGCLSVLLLKLFSERKPGQDFFFFFFWLGLRLTQSLLFIVIPSNRCKNRLGKQRLANLQVLPLLCVL